MKKVLCYLLAAFCGTCCVVNASMTDEPSYNFEDSYKYVSAGLGPIFPVPSIGVGYRQRFADQWGWDSALNFSTVGTAHQVSAQLLVHYYLNAQNYNSMYVGTGVRACGFLINKDRETAGAVSLDTVVGKALATEGDSSHFIEMHVCTPGYWTNNKIRAITGRDDGNFTAASMVYITYGVGF